MFKPVTQNINFPELEKKILDYWYSAGIVEKYLKKNDKSQKRFSFLDGPITANNPMGVHHAWGRTYKDLWQRYFNMRGYKQRFQNGFDCQGLWIEVEVEKELGIKNKKDIENLVPNDRKASIAKFVELCKERVIRFSQVQAEQSKRLGYFMKWENSYYTMSDENNYMIWYFLKTCHDNGWIYKGKDSVPWCPRCETAISQHEMLTEDYKELTHETIFVKLKVKNERFDIKAKNLFLLIWTTTPWTVPANVAVGVNTKFTYAIWEHKDCDEALVIVDRDENGQNPTWEIKGKKVYLSEFILEGGEGEFVKVAEVSGKELLGLRYEAPFDDLPLVLQAERENPKTFHTVVDGSEIVVSSEGTGLLHIAPGAGKEDFDLGKKEKLPVISVIADNSDYLNDMGNFSGMNAKKHPEIIIDHLKDFQGGRYLLKTMSYLHRYPACWRCKTELVWKVAEEWYIAMDRYPLQTQNSKIKDKNKKTLREQMKEVAKKIHWVPDFGLERELDWLINMNDWLISKKNRYWGLALPIYECKSCGWFDVVGSKDELRMRVVSGWDKFEGKSPHKPFIDEVKIKCGRCDQITSRIDDVGNVWLDAGIVPFSTYIDPKTNKLSYITNKKYWQEWFPADFITESFPGQFKNWFYSMIAMSTVLENKNPFVTVLGYASVLGEDGRPMHKSWGNAIEFNEAADKIGVDVMRWMFVTNDPEQNILFGYHRADETRRKFHLLLWNIYNFFVTYANLDGWFLETDRKLISLNILDRWILSKLNSLIGIVITSFDQYGVSKGALAIEAFVTDLSQWYVRRSRDRVGPTVDQCRDKDDCYHTLYTVLVTLCQLLSPFIPYLTEEIYRNLTGKESIHLSIWPERNKRLIDLRLEKEMLLARKIVEAGHSLRKEYRLKTRQPLVNAWYEGPTRKRLDKEVSNLILQELNIKSWISQTQFKPFVRLSDVIHKEIDGFSIYLNTDLTKVRNEGQARELIRQIQMKRKELGCRLNERINLTLPGWPEEFTDYIQKETLAVSIRQGSELAIERT